MPALPSPSCWYYRLKLNTAMAMDMAGTGPSGKDWCGVMSSFAVEEIPIITTLAEEFAVMDRMFCSHPGPTWPNRKRLVQHLHCTVYSTYSYSHTCTCTFKPSPSHLHLHTFTFICTCTCTCTYTPKCIHIWILHIPYKMSWNQRTDILKTSQPLYHR